MQVTQRANPPFFNPNWTIRIFSGGYSRASANVMTILLVSLLVLVPSHPRESQGLLVDLNAVIGVSASIIICMRILTRANMDYAVDWTDRLAYGAAPVLAYVGLLVAGVLVFLDRDTGADILTASLLLLIANIGNAWNITLVLARRRSGSP